MHISENGLKLIESFEGFSSRPYWDSLGRVWTRGFGETEGITQASPAISRQEGETRLRALVQARYEPAIRALGVPFNQNQWDALCSFAWNLGAGIFTGDLRAALQARAWQRAAAIMLEYDHAGGAVIPGLARRRRLETALFLRASVAYIPADELRWEREYDTLTHMRGPWAALRRRVLQRYMRRRIFALLHAAEYEGGWTIDNRQNRYRRLLVRTR